jgi:hypothetical protein
MNNQSPFWNSLSWFAGICFLIMGIINTFWGNDLFLGLGLLILSFFYFPKVSAYVKATSGFYIPGFLKIVLAGVLLWIVMGVGELPAKIDLMLESF